VTNDRSGTIIAGGSAQDLGPADPYRNSLFVQNNSADKLTIEFQADADATSFEIQPNGGVFNAGADFKELIRERISIWGPTTGQAFTARDGQK
jgi:hypothetical protein